jgi:hypothetical protein
MAFNVIFLNSLKLFDGLGLSVIPSVIYLIFFKIKSTEQKKVKRNKKIKYLLQI